MLVTSRARARVRPRLLTAAVSAVLVASGALVAAPAQASRWTVPGDSVIRIDGRGFGHGHGMSQYGAQGAAQAGLTHQQIAEFYYPGTAWGTSTGRVRVLITADTTDDVVVHARPHLRVRDLGKRRVWNLPGKRATQWRLSTDRRARTVVQFRRARGGWVLWKRLAGDGEFVARGPITLVTPSGVRAYRGKLRAASPTPGSRVRDTVNVVPLEQYLRGVVPLEIPASWHPEAVRAQAVAARTYASFERAHPLARHYQICDTTSCQVYGGATAEHPASDEAIAATRHRILTADGGPAFTQFNASSGGWTSAGSRPYLAAQQDPYDGWAGNPVHTWSLTVTDRRLEEAWPVVGDLQQLVIEERDGNGAWGGRVRRVRLVGSAGAVTVTGDQFRSALGLRSNWFDFAVTARAGLTVKPERALAP